MEMEVRSLLSTEFYGENSVLTKALALLATVICASQLFGSNIDLIWFHFKENWDWGKVVNLGAVSKDYIPGFFFTP